MEGISLSGTQAVTKDEYIGAGVETIVVWRSGLQPGVRENILRKVELGENIIS
jgi:hypothetical protein